MPNGDERLDLSDYPKPPGFEMFCGECDFFIGNRSATNTPGCSLDPERTTHYKDDPCEEYKQCQMGVEARKRLS